MKVLVTGGTGSLGRPLVRALTRAGHLVRIMSRRPRRVAAETEWAQADIASGNGVRAAVHGVDVVVHAATDPRHPDAVDVDGTQHLIEAARSTGIGHLIYVSIVGIDDIPLAYYKRKIVAEAIVTRSGVPHTIVRATQFHALIDMLLSFVGRVPVVMPLPAGVMFQSVAESDVADRLVECLADGPRGRAADVGGPDVLSLREMARTWMDVRSVRKTIIPVPIPGRVAAGFRAGRNTTSRGVRGVIRWREWLEARTMKEKSLDDDLS